MDYGNEETVTESSLKVNNIRQLSALVSFASRKHPARNAHRSRICRSPETKSSKVLWSAPYGKSCDTRMLMNCHPALSHLNTLHRTREKCATHSATVELLSTLTSYRSAW